MVEDFVIPTEVFEQLERVRASGRINMMDRPNIEAIAHDLDCYALVDYIERTKRHTWPLVLGEFGKWRKGREIDG